MQLAGANGTGGHVELAREERPAWRWAGLSVIGERVEVVEAEQPCRQ
jgi:hypothetical protein